MTRHNEAGAIIAHYLRQLTQASGRRWTPANDHDMRRLAELLADEDRETIAPFYQPAAPPELSVEPPAAEPARQLDTRVTTVLERHEPAARQAVSADDLDDPEYQRWRQQRQQDEQTRRMLQREQR